MVDRKSGPVKPPVIDATVRKRDVSGSDATEPQSKSAVPPTPEQGAAEKKATAQQPPIPQRQEESPKAQPRQPVGPNKPGAESVVLLPFLASTAGGALIGLALAYGLALAGFWPGQPDTVGDRIAGLENRLSQMETAAQTGPAAGDLALRLDELDTQIRVSADAQSEQAASFSEMIPTMSERLNEFDQTLTDLSLRLDAVAAGASTADAEAISAQLGQLQNEMSSLSDAVETLNSAAPAVDQRLSALEAISATQPDLEALQRDQQRNAALGNALRAFEQAISSGDPFAPQLATLEGLQPSLTVPQALRAASTVGLPTRHDLLSAYRAKLPDLIAARPRQADTNWFDSLVHQAQSTLSLRLAGDLEGNDPDALIARGETALERGDIAIALSVFENMPDGMRLVLADLIANGQVHVDAERLAAEVRDEDTAGEAPQ